jgi:hypothetical protein
MPRQSAFVVAILAQLVAGPLADVQKYILPYLP